MSNQKQPYPMARIHALHEFPPFATPYAKSCFCFPSLWQSKRKKPNFFAKNDSGKTLAEVTEKTLFQQYKCCNCSQSKQILLKMCTKSPSQLRSLDRYCDGTFGSKWNPYFLFCDDLYRYTIFRQTIILLQF